MRRHAVVATMVLLLGLVAAAAHRSAPRTHTVQIEGMRFSPATVVVERGDTIVWVNTDLVPHTVTSAEGALDSATIAPGTSWRWTAGTAAALPYVCTLHPTMSGRVDVR